MSLHHDIPPPIQYESENKELPILKPHPWRKGTTLVVGDSMIAGVR